MRKLHYCLFLGALAGGLACGDANDDVLLRRTANGRDAQAEGAAGNAATGSRTGTGETTNGSGGGPGVGGGAGTSTGSGGGAGATGGSGGSGSAGSGGSGTAGAGGVGSGTPGLGKDAGVNGGPVGTAGGTGVDAGVGSDGSGAGGTGGRLGSDAAADKLVNVNEAGVPDAGTRDGNAPEGSLPEASVPDAANAGAWLHTAGKHLYLGSNVFHGRGANYHDTRGCNACAYSGPNVAEVNRRADELIDNWKANFVRLDLESSPSADNRVQWQGVLDDPIYQADVQTMVKHVTDKGAYVLLSLWIEPSTTVNELPTAATNAVWRKLADMFKNEPRVLFGITNEPRNDTDATVWAAMNTSVAAIREVEAQAGTPKHIIAVQGTQQWARVLDYYVTHPITAGGGENIVYETHVYDPASDFAARFETPSQTLPVIIGEFGEQDADALMQRAEAAQVSYLAWTFHGRCPPNLIVDNSGGGCGVGMDLVPTAFGQKLKNRLATPW